MINTASDMKMKIDYALAYAAMGWAVFPVHYIREDGKCSCNEDSCKSPGKHPATTNGALGATTNPEVLRSYFKDDRMNIAICPGRSDPKFTVVDVDPRNGGVQTLEALTDIHGNLPDTVTALTGGGGFHYLFIVPEGKRIKALGQGIDIQSGNKYIVAEPSNHSSGNNYAWEGSSDPFDGVAMAYAPAWLLEDINATTEAPEIKSNDAPISNETIADLRSCFAYLDVDSYGSWLQIGQALHAANSGNQGFGLWVEASQLSIHYDPAECRKKWGTFTASKGITIKSLFKQAQDNGWLNRASNLQSPISEIRANFEPLEIGDDLLSQVSKIKKRQWLILSHFLRGYVSATFAPGGVGKSMFQLTLSVSVATGMDLLGLGVEESSPVMVINNEDDYDEMKRRLAGILVYFKIPPSVLKDRLFMLSGYGNPFTIARRLPDGTIIASPESGKLTDFIKEKGIGLVCLDPFISTHESEENANTEINKVISQYKHIAHETQCAISLIHHTAKNGQDSEAHAGDANSGRGASSLKDAARCVDTLAKMNQETAAKLEIAPEERPRYIRMDNGKLNFALGLGEAQWFYMNSVQIPNGDWVGVPCPVSLAHLFDRASQSDKRVKWTPTMVAEAFHNLMPKGVDSIPFSDIKANFMERHDISDSKAREKSTMISASPKSPTRIKVHNDYIDFWYTKEKQTSPVIIHRCYR